MYTFLHYSTRRHLNRRTIPPQTQQQNLKHREGGEDRCRLDLLYETYCKIYIAEGRGIKRISLARSRRLLDYKSHRDSPPPSTLFPTRFHRVTVQTDILLAASTSANNDRNYSNITMLRKWYYDKSRAAFIANSLSLSLSFSPLASFLFSLNCSDTLSLRFSPSSYLPLQIGTRDIIRTDR